MSDTLMSKLRAKVDKGLGYKLSFYEASELVSTEEPPMSVGCCGADKMTAAIYLDACTMGFDDRQIVAFLSIISNRVYDVLATGDDKALLQQIVDQWCRAGLYPCKSNYFSVKGWVAMLSDVQIASLGLPRVPESVLLALMRTHNGIQERLKSDKQKSAQ